MRILDAWLRDLPQQFLGLPKIETLISAFARQLQELEQVFADINEQTDLNTASGRNLDYIGTIIPLSRKDAGLLAGERDPDYEMSDELYRRYLKYWRLVNTEECTYRDLMDGLALLWDATQVHYQENPGGSPARIHLRTEISREMYGTDLRYLMNMPLPRAAGVRIHMDVALMEEAVPAKVCAKAACTGVYWRQSASPVDLRR